MAEVDRKRLNDSQYQDGIFLFENYDTETRDLHISMKKAGLDILAVAIEDDGFLPDDVMSVYGYFLGDSSSAEGILGRPRYFDEVQVPEYWEISGNNNMGRIHDYAHERGKIFYAEPKHKRLVKMVDWYDDRGVGRACDHYNKYGEIFARTVLSAEAKKVNKSYFDVNGKERIVENFATGDIILNKEKGIQVFRNKNQFILYFLQTIGMGARRLIYNTLSTPFLISESLPGHGNKEDILFWRENARDDIPGNMQLILKGKAARTGSIFVQKKDAYEKLISLGADKNVLKSLGFVYDFERENNGGNQVLICTNSDRIESIDRLITELPMLRFNIAALTEMSAKLLDLRKYPNVELHPNVKQSKLEDLFKKCDWYFDVNYELEIVSAVRRAFLNNHAIFAFNETVHNRNFIQKSGIYRSCDIEMMISKVKELSADKGKLGIYLDNQHKTAGLEDASAYEIVNTQTLPLVKDCNKETISIVIPCYNAEKYIDRCFESIKNQSYGIENLDVIFVDDVSADSTLEILEGYKKLYPDNVRVIKKEKNSGPGGSRNIGMKEARGKYLMFVDSDDYFDISMLDKMYSKMLEYDCEMVQCGHKVVFGGDAGGSRCGDDVYYDLSDENQRRKYIVNFHSMAVWARLFKMDFLRDNKLSFIENVIYEDNHFVFLCKLLLHSTYYINEQLYYYYMNGESVTHKKYSEEVEDGIYDIMDRVQEDLIERNCFEEIKEKYWSEYQFVMAMRMYVDPGIRVYMFMESEKKAMKDELKKRFPDIGNNCYLNSLQHESNKTKVEFLNK